MRIDFTLKINADVLILPIEDCGGRVISAMWNGKEQMYLVLYWLNGTRETEWLYEWEIELDEDGDDADN